MSGKPEPLMTSGDVAAFLQVPEHTLREWRYRGEGPTFVKVGRSVRYRPADLRQWLAKHEVPAA